MKPEAKEWLDRADRDLETAEYNLKGSMHEAAALFAQQCAEKALKAHSIETRGAFKKTHDLVELGRDAGLVAETLRKCAALSAAYLATTYPDTPGQPDLIQASDLITAAKEVLEWVRSKIL